MRTIKILMLAVAVMCAVPAVMYASDSDYTSIKKNSGSKKSATPQSKKKQYKKPKPVQTWRPNLTFHFDENPPYVTLAGKAGKIYFEDGGNCWIIRGERREIPAGTKLIVPNNHGVLHCDPRFTRGLDRDGTFTDKDGLMRAEYRPGERVEFTGADGLTLFK